MSDSRRIVPIGVAVLVAVLTVAAGVALTVLGSDAGRVRAVAFAAAVAGAAAIAGWIVGRQGRGQPATALAGGLAATVIRMLPLLAALAWLVGRDQSPWAKTAGGLLVAFHLVLLLTDMILQSLAERFGGGPLRAPENRPSTGADDTN